MPHAQEYAKDKLLRVPDPADPSAENRRKTIDGGGLSKGAKQYDDRRAMLRDHPRHDGAIICAPNNLHADQAIACLERAMSVACENPGNHTGRLRTHPERRTRP